ncbi:MAG: radical SAM protein [Bacteroidota bacterium]
MRILLVSPCLKSEIRPNQFAIPHMTLSLIAAMTPTEHEVMVCEEVYGDIIDYDGDYDLIGISLMSQTCLRGYEIANEFKKREKTVIFGGIHASARPEEALRYGDAVVIGEADGGLWPQLLSDVKNKKLKPFYKLDNLPDLQEYIPPRRDLIKCTSGSLEIAPIEATRGCPYNCDFCSVSRVFGIKQRHKIIRNIIMDAESCPQKHLFFVDDNIALDRKFAIRLFTEMIPLNKIWVGQTSIKLSNDEELMKLAYKSGCRGLLIGFESMTEAGINSYRKTLKTVEKNIIAIKKLRNNGILTMASVVFGLDSDTEAVFDITHDFLLKSKPAFLQACLMTPYPGTQVFEHLKSEGRILTDDWSKYDTKKVVVSPKNISTERLEQGYAEIRKSTYTMSSIFNRALPHILMGIPETLLYFSLNIGARITYKKSDKTNIYRNPGDLPIDFDTAKYIKPFKK